MEHAHITPGLDFRESSEMTGKYLTFWTDNQLFGIPIVHVVQISSMQNITEIPEFPHYAKGIINMRGAIIPVVDVRLRLGKQEAAYNERTCIIITDINESLVGIIVDEVDAVVAIEDENISRPPKPPSGTDSYITGIGKMDGRVILLMEPHKIVGVESLQLVTEPE